MQIKDCPEDKKPCVNEDLIEKLKAENTRLKSENQMYSNIFDLQKLTIGMYRAILTDTVFACKMGRVIHLHNHSVYELQIPLSTVQKWEEILRDPGEKEPKENDCPLCHGTRVLVCSGCSGSENIPVCVRCNGRGKINCPRCKGSEKDDESWKGW